MSAADRSAACGGRRPDTWVMLLKTTPPAIAPQMPSGIRIASSTVKCTRSCGISPVIGPAFIR